MMIQPELLVKYIGPILIITVATILGQMIFSTIGILLSGQSLHTAIRGGFSMVQIGEFSFIIATLGSSLGVISDFLYPVVVCVSVITTFTTPLFIKNSASVYKFLDEKLPDKLWVFIKKNTSEDRSNKDKDEDWSKYIKKVLSRTLICSVVMYIIYWLGIQELKPLVDTYVSSEIFADLITAVVTCGVMIPFISMMHGTNDALFIKLWLKQRSNKLPLLTLKTVRILIAACFVTLVLRKIYHIPFVILLLLSAAAVVLLIRSDYLKGVTINMELRFMENFSERTLARQKRERGRDEKYSWLNEELLVAEFQVTDTVENKTIYDFTKSRAFRVTIIKIIRGDK